MRGLWTRNFSILFSGQLVSTIGNSLFFLALPWYVFSMTHSKSMLVLVGLAQTLPMVAGLFTGVFIDRWQKRTVMLISDTIRALLCALLFISVLSHASIWTLLCIVLALQFVGTFFGPASNAILPLLVDDSQLEAGIGLFQSTNGVSQLIGTVAGGALLLLLGAPLLFLLNAITFLLSALSLMFLRVQEVKLVHTGDGSASFFSSMRVGWMVLFRSKFMILMVAAALIANFAFAPIDIGLTAWVKGSMQGTSLDLGLISGAFCAGMIGGSVAMAWFTRHLPIRWLVCSSLLIMGLTVGIITLSNSTLWAASLLFLTGFASGTLNGTVGVLLIRSIPAAVRARVFGTMTGLAVLAMPLGMGVFGAILAHDSIRLVFLLSGSIAILSGLLILLPIRDDVANLARDVEVA